MHAGDARCRTWKRGVVCLVGFVASAPCRMWMQGQPYTNQDTNVMCGMLQIPQHCARNEMPGLA